MFFKLLFLAAACFTISAIAPRTDHQWSAADLRTLRAMSIEMLGPPPADPTNRVADDPGAVVLGQLLFADKRMSGNGRVSCASCHDPAHGFTDARAKGRGMGIGSRRTMPIAPAVYPAWQFWDGRADSLWAQALGPIENPVEHGFTRGQVFDLVRRSYAQRYEEVFGTLPNLTAGVASPLGDASARRRWRGMSASDRLAIDTVFANVGKAIAAFERRQRIPETRFDHYVRWLSDGTRAPSPMSVNEVAGLRIFIGKGRCSTCHAGPLFTNNEFANTGVPDSRRDRGRALAVALARADPFNCHGRFNDAPERVCDELDFAATDNPEQEGAFKVPSLRQVTQRPPFMHAGQFSSLAGVVDHYRKAPRARIGTSQLRPVALTRVERRQLIAFLTSLNPVVSDRDCGSGRGYRCLNTSMPIITTRH